MSKPLGLGVKVFSASLGVFIPKCFHNKLFRGREAGFALRTPWPLAGLQAGGTAGGQFAAPTRGRRSPCGWRGVVLRGGGPRARWAGKLPLGRALTLLALQSICVLNL